jgi:hypothetical protein
MDNQGTESSNSALNVDSAAQAFGALLDPQPIEEKSAKELENEVLEDLTNPKAEAEETEPQDEQAEEDDEGVTIEVDGKQVKLSKAELADAYKNGLRQTDYTKKTMEVAEQRKAAQAELQKAAQERQAYAQNLQKIQAQLEVALEQQQNIDWQHLIDNDPVEYLKQQHLFQQRQAAYQNNLQQLQHVEQLNQQEQQKAQSEFLRMQQEELLAKLPEWKDSAKAKAESQAIANHLLEMGFDQSQVSSIQEHKLIILAREAMLYRAMMNKANAASKKVASAPQKVLKPSVGESPASLDKRSAAMRQLSKTGKVEDAAGLFAQIL